MRPLFSGEDFTPHDFAKRVIYLLHSNMTTLQWGALTPQTIAKEVAYLHNFNVTTL